MRIHIKMTKNFKPVPFNYQENLAGAFHKWVKNEKIHDDTSLYSFSWLQGGKGDNDQLNFRNGAVWTISAFDNALLKVLIKAIQKDPVVAFGMSVQEISIQEDPVFSQKETFRLLSPVFIKRTIEDRKYKFYYYDDPESSVLLTETLTTKLNKAGLSAHGVKVHFNTSLSIPKIKKIRYKGIDCKASYCPVTIEGSPEQIAFAWNAGVGNSTGIGFGALK